jgi:ribosomal protein S18 acetylase RimI-like enzyme
MIIRSYSSLSEKVLNEILTLEKVGKEQDKLKGSVFLDTSSNFDQQIHSVFLLYEDRQLISILSMLIPTQQEAEISAYTLPDYRRNGYFKALLAKAIEELRRFNIRKFLLVCERQSISGQEVMVALKAEYEHAEYSLRLNKTKYAAKNAYRLSLIRPRFEDLDKVIDASMKTFADSYDEAKSLVENCFESESREQYLAVLNNEIIGLGSVNRQSDAASIFGFGIVPEYRGKGYGEELLHLMIDHLWRMGITDIMLDVSSENIQALKLYKKSGFQTEGVYEYYRKK